MAELPFSSQQAPPVSQPTFFRGTLSLSDAPTDTYIRFPGFTKGLAWINGFNIGRYWNPRGPQNNFYVPASLLQSGTLPHHGLRAMPLLAVIDSPFLRQYEA